MSSVNPFIYAEESDLVYSDDLVVRIPVGIGSFADLFAVYFKQLELPGYTGHNWNALSDSLRDLSWVRQRRVILLHQDVPTLSPPDTVQYLDVLRESAVDWKPGEEHELVVVFPERFEEVVTAHLRTS